MHSLARSEKLGKVRNEETVGPIASSRKPDGRKVTFMVKTENRSFDENTKESKLSKKGNGKECRDTALRVLIYSHWRGRKRRNGREDSCLPSGMRGDC